MKIMSINAGSSSLKFRLLEMDTEEVLASGLFERIGIPGSNYVIKYQGQKVEQEIPLENHEEAVKILLDKLIDLSVISSLSEIEGVGHRVVHGGDLYQQSVLVTDKVIEDLLLLKDFAPLHNPAHVQGIKAFKEVLPSVPMAVVFDTAFHQTMDPVSYLYPVPYSWYQDHKVRKYGAHGTSHRYVSLTLTEKLGRNDLKIISCHLGNGGSITAIKDGKCVDTSMGFTPLAGIMMGTRSGDIDPSIIPYVMEKEGKNASEVIDDLNKKSGFLGLSCRSSDARDIILGSQEGDLKCEIALEKYVKTVVSYIAQYYVLLGGADVICFTAGIGENSVPIRMRVMEKLACLGIRLDASVKPDGDLTKISTDDSLVDCYVLPTDEELMIARDTLELIKNS